MISSRSRKIADSVFLCVFLAVSSVIILTPMYLILVNSLKSTTEASVPDLSLPGRFLFSNYAEVFIKGNILRSLKNALLISLVSVTVIILINSITAFIIQRRNTRLNEFLYNLFLLGLVAPLAMIPQMKILQFFRVNGTYLAIILVHIAVNTPFTILLYTGFIKGIPRDMDEAAIIDGCGPYRLFYQIIFPLLKPVIMTSLIIVFMNIWNDFQYTLYFVTRASMWTMPMTVYNFFGFHTADYNLVSADIMFCVVPVVIIFLLAQKYIISGMLAGAIKG